MPCSLKQFWSHLFNNMKSWHRRQNTWQPSSFETTHHTKHNVVTTNPVCSCGKWSHIQCGLGRAFTFDPVKAHLQPTGGNPLPLKTCKTFLYKFFFALKKDWSKKASVLALMPLDVYVMTACEIHRTLMRHEFGRACGSAQSITDRRRGNALERGGVKRDSEGERGRERESAQADLYLSPTDIFRCCNTRRRGRADLWQWHIKASCAPFSEDVQR